MCTDRGFYADVVIHDQKHDHFKYKRLPDDQWNGDGGWSGGAGGGGGYAYLGMDNDHFEESLGWQAYGMAYEQHGWGTAGCLGVAQHSPRQGLGTGYQGYLWIKRGFRKV